MHNICIQNMLNKKKPSTSSSFILEIIYYTLFAAKCLPLFFLGEIYLTLFVLMTFSVLVYEHKSASRQMLGHISTRIDSATLCAVVLPLLSIHDSERVFSMVIKTEIDCRSNLSQETTCSLPSCH